MNIQNRGSRLFFATLLILTIAATACAYVDPGTGSAIIQVAIAAFVAVGFALKSYWKALLGFVAGIFGAKRRS